MRLIVTGTDTGVGKTIFAAGLAKALGACYWKPIQAGLDAPTDSEVVADLARLRPERIMAEAYRLTTPCSPHRAAEIDGLTIELDRLGLPEAEPLVIEGAGGVLVPVTRELLMADLFRIWRLPVVLVARTSLGTINHSLLSIEALRARSIPILGVAFVGDPVEDSEASIAAIGRVKRLGRLPQLDALSEPELAKAFRSSFDVQDFT